MLEDDSRETTYQDYTATCLSMIGRLIGQKAWELPPFVELVYPERAKPVDTRSAQQIIQDMLGRLG